MTHLTAVPDAEAVARRAATEIGRHLQHAREQRGIAHLALSGGTTPARTYELLASELADWSAIEIWFVDERCVDPDDEQSNHGLAARTLLDPASIPPTRVHRMLGETGPEVGAERYAVDLMTRLVPDGRGVPVLDLCVLGIGEDGHVGSLFPKDPRLGIDSEAICFGVSDSPKPPPERITLSMAVLRSARRCLLLATGPTKTDAVAAMLGEPSLDVPASLLRRVRLTVIVDDDASPPSTG